ncbi:MULTISPECIES: hypothetical protein [unclassified Cryobacterium]|uniref:hypothetical protein n=1 Tax=unclassified Cryobacterium TaxID=2649013 RepID=UPI002AB4E881|nr:MULTISPECIES: hypothetical protein [unclassified Cryobacterium]MDY7528850.1 hypothetical protein [Cryobacterium sp. 10C2]MDY7555410.1 hypothetical protein [Cryobacterium sp. 10C3]MEB0201045.1 hypothetical protein [Cryobacterium sp. 5I3]MEB0288467.1 hypothetical protein [Cryobacterium sp. 10S3]MEB0291444.1 hypothetical protein [Cryobacterium sp. 10C2]
MPELLSAVAVIGGIAAVLASLIALAARARRRGATGAGVAGAMAAYDEAFHGTAHDTYVEVQAQADRTVPIPAPDDH